MSRESVVLVCCNKLKSNVGVFFVGKSHVVALQHYSQVLLTVSLYAVLEYT